MKKSKSIATIVIHGGDQVDRGNNAIPPPSPPPVLLFNLT